MTQTFQNIFAIFFHPLLRALIYLLATAKVCRHRDENICFFLVCTSTPHLSWLRYLCREMERVWAKQFNDVNKYAPKNMYTHMYRQSATHERLMNFELSWGDSWRNVICAILCIGGFIDINDVTCKVMLIYYV